MSAFEEVLALITAAPVTPGYAPTGQALPYCVARPVSVDTAATAIGGSEFARATTFIVYCAGGSVMASFNLAELVVADLSGKRVAGTTLATSIGYIGAEVEGHYESAVTVQLNTGGI